MTQFPGSVQRSYLSQSGLSHDDTDTWSCRPVGHHCNSQWSAIAIHRHRLQMSVCSVQVGSNSTPIMSRVHDADVSTVVLVRHWWVLCHTPVIVAVPSKRVVTIPSFTILRSPRSCTSSFQLGLWPAIIAYLICSLTRNVGLRNIEAITGICCPSSRLVQCCESVHCHCCWTAKYRIYRALLCKVDSEYCFRDSSCSLLILWWAAAMFQQPMLPMRRHFIHTFDAKVADVHAVTADAQPPSFTPLPPGCLLVEFQTLTATDVAATVHALSNMQSTRAVLLTS